MFNQIILIVIAFLFLFLIIEIRKIRKLLQGSNESVKVSPIDIRDNDELLKEAKEIIVEYQKASASLLQRKLRIGYARAAAVLDQLEEQGHVGPARGAGAKGSGYKK